MLMSRLLVSNFCLNHLVSLCLPGSSGAAASAAHRTATSLQLPPLASAMKSTSGDAQASTLLSTPQAAQSVGTVTNPQIIRREFLKQRTVYRATESS